VFENQSLIEIIHVFEIVKIISAINRSWIQITFVIFYIIRQ
jgi:hypothetical protein